MASPTVALLEPEILELVRDGKYRELRVSLRQFDHADIAEMLGGLIEQEWLAEAAIAYRVLPRADAAEVFAALEADEQEELIGEFGAERAWRVVESLDPDDRARLLDELPVEVTRRILRKLTPESRRETQAILGYPAETVGRMMTPDYVKVRRGSTVGEALTQVRRFGQDAETINWIYVVDDEGELVDDIHIRPLVLAEPGTALEGLLDGRFTTLNVMDDREEAVRQMARHDRSAMPVVDGLGLLVGIVTYDDIADVAEIEATEDIHKLGGLEALDAPYLKTRLGEMLRKRAGWLAGLFLMQLLTIAVMGFFDEQLDKAVILALFVPLIVSSGGNTGTQAASLLVRALALDHVEPGDWKRVLGREVVTGLVLGSLLGVLGLFTVVGCDFVGIAESDYPWRVGFVVGTSVVGIVLWGSLAGSALPLVMQKLRLDPAASSSPLVATIMDVSGLTIYFTIAVIVLSGNLL